MVECTADEYEELARQLHESIVQGQSIELTAKALRILATPAPEAGGLDVETLARAMCLANGDTPEQAEKFYEREIEEATRIVAEYARLREQDA